MTVLVGLAGAVLLGVVFQDAFEVMLLPRRVRRRARIGDLFFRATWTGWRWIARGLFKGRPREGFLSLYGPLSMVGLMVIWAVGLIVGFGMLQWVLGSGGPGWSGFLRAEYFSGVTFFTLGYGDITPQSGLTRALAVVEAGSGLGFIAVVIGYLPVLYQLFSRREAHVILMDARAGSPPTAASLLVRHADGESLDALERFLRDWELWAAELVESHVSYPMLSYYRSQHENESWLAALTTVMDCCALILVGLQDVRTFQARMTFAAGRLAVLELSRVFAVAPSAPRVDRLGTEDFAILRSQVEAVGMSFSDPETALSTLEAFRRTYEPFVNALSIYLLMAMPPWYAPEERLDNWQKSRRGPAVKQLLESVPAKGGAPDPHEKQQIVSSE